MDDRERESVETESLQVTELEEEKLEEAAGGAEIPINIVCDLPDIEVNSVC